MRKLLAIVWGLFVSVSGFSQSWTDAINTSGGIAPLENNSGFTSNDLQHLRGNWSDWSKIIGVLGEFDDITLEKKGIDGSVMFFDKEHKGKLYIGDKVYAVDNINYHIQGDRFQTRMKNDSVFIYHLDGLKRVIINNKDFSILYNSVEKKEKVYEVIEPGIRISLVKDHTIKFQKASPNPMVNRRKAKLIKKWKYYTVDNDRKIFPFKAKKKFLLEMIKDSEKRDQLKKYIADQKLTVKKEEDLKKIFKYLNTI